MWVLYQTHVKMRLSGAHGSGREKGHQPQKSCFSRILGFLFGSYTPYSAVPALWKLAEPPRPRPVLKGDVGCLSSSFLGVMSSWA